MKHIAKKIFATGVVSTLVLSSGVAVIPASANALDDLLSGAGSATADTVVATELKVSGVTALPKDGKVSLVWNPVSDGDAIVTKYEILYGTQSVEEAIAESYDKTPLRVNLDAEVLQSAGLAKYDVPSLKNGEKYFFSLRAITADGTKGVRSEEVFSTPSSDVAVAPTDEDVLMENIGLQLVEGRSLTTTIVKVTLSKNIVLPEDEEVLISSFVVNVKNEPDTVLEVKAVILRDNYYIAENDITAERAEKDNEIYIILTDEMTIEKEYQITVSARIKDEDGKSIENGIVDNVVFSGTDELEIAEDEKPESAKKNILKAVVPVVTPAEVLVSPTPEPELKGAPTEKKPTEKALVASGEEDNLKGAPTDINPPEEVTNLTYLLKKRVKDFVVTLSWDISKNTAGDAIKQLLYISLDNGKTWGAPKDLAADKEEYPFTAAQNKIYVVKLSTQDRSGNESKGVIKTIRIPGLVSSGAPAFLAFGLALMGGGFLAMRRRKFV